MGCINSITIAGNVGRDPELRQAGAAQCAEFSVATTQRWRDQSGAEKSNTDWHRVMVWGNFAGIVAREVAKGMTVTVHGSMHYREWTDKDGNKRTSAEIKASEVVWQSSGSSSSSARSDRDDRPSRPAGNRPKQDRFDDADIPF